MGDGPNRFAAILDQFPRERHWLLPALQAVQHALGYLPAEALTLTGAHLRVPASEVYGVATHYPEFRLRPRGRHAIRVCTRSEERRVGKETTTRWRSGVGKS